jgi:hypothetical protein
LPAIVLNHHSVDVKLPERTTPGPALPLATIKLLLTTKPPLARLMPPPLFIVMTSRRA